MSMEARARAFVENYYAKFDTNMMGLLYVYKQVSTLIISGFKIHGADSIVHYLMGLPFVRYRHTIISVDVAPFEENNVMFVFVTGSLHVTTASAVYGELNFTQLFNVLRDEDNIDYIFNDFFRLNNT